ncbi:MAG: curli assembly protein CsgF [Lewinellaceae bacterium]|nr:curli assembly protein CsgF [Phaeodactylibacter sp.]MCB0612563.1 curli assembly protein CsgF [Phaeodactylibacter sp.]MCB9349468.1 curli assembly protein CsgF [Lewinellaceae bacterium]
MNITSKLLTLFLLTAPILMYGQDFSYTPTNPAFGGNYLNYSWLLNSANAQNTLSNPDAGNNGRTSLDRFTESLNNQLLSQLSRNLLQSDSIFGENGIQTGTYEFGDILVDVVPGLDGLIITINDLATGNQTQITIPFF